MFKKILNENTGSVKTKKNTILDKLNIFNTVNSIQTVNSLIIISVWL